MSLFEKLNKVDVNNHKKKKGQFDYLSWALAVQELLKVCPDAEWEVHEYQSENGLTAPYMTTSSGCFVKVSLTCEGVTRSQVHPVTDHRHQTIKDPNAQQINTSIQRCLAKVIALHGLGLYIFAGEDLPNFDNSTSQPQKSYKPYKASDYMKNNMRQIFSAKGVYKKDKAEAIFRELTKEDGQRIKDLMEGGKIEQAVEEFYKL